MLRSRLRSDDGFTLVELMVTMVLFVLLVSIAVPVFLVQSNAVKAQSVRSDVHALATNVKTSLQWNPNATGFKLYVGSAVPTVPAGTLPVRNTSQSGGNQFKLIGPVLCNANPLSSNTTASAAGYSVVGWSGDYYYWYNSVSGEYYDKDSFNATTNSCTPDNSYKSK